MVLAACGDEVDRDLPLGARLTSEAATRGVPPAPTMAPAGTAVPVISAAPQPTLDAVAVAQLNSLARLVLSEQDLGPDYALQRSDRSLRAAIVETQAGIPELAAFLNGSSLQGAWAALYGRTTPPGGVMSSVVYLFGAPADAIAFVETYGAIQTTDYIGAIDVQRINLPVVGERSIAVRFRTTSGRALEVVWAQGPLAGQIIIRYAEDTEDPGDIDRLGQLTSLQAQRMAAALP